MPEQLAGAPIGGGEIARIVREKDQAAGCGDRSRPGGRFKSDQRDLPAYFAALDINGAQKELTRLGRNGIRARPVIALPFGIGTGGATVEIAFFQSHDVEQSGTRIEGRRKIVGAPYNPRADSPASGSRVHICN